MILYFLAYIFVQLYLLAALFVSLPALILEPGSNAIGALGRAGRSPPGTGAGSSWRCSSSA